LQSPPLPSALPQIGLPPRRSSAPSLPHLHPLTSSPSLSLLSLSLPQVACRAAMTTAPTSATAPRAVVWLRTDLRVRDNPALAAAARLVADGAVSGVVPFYSFDVGRWFQATWVGGFPKTGPARAKFLLEAVADLKASLSSPAIGSGLAVDTAPPEAAIPGLLGPAPAGAVVLAAPDACPEERAAEDAVRAALAAVGAELRLVGGPGTSGTLLDPAAMAARYGGPGFPRLPGLFTAWRKEVEAPDAWAVPAPLPAPAAGSLPLPPADPALAAALAAPAPRTLADLAPAIAAAGGPPLVETAAPRPPPSAQVLAFTGGETAALARLRHYLWGSRAASTYFDTRNGAGPLDSTKFSPWLAAGCLSPRTIDLALSDYEREHGANKSTYWIRFELLWRDYFRFWAAKHGAKVFARGGPAPRPGAAWKAVVPGATPAFDRWVAGTTGIPYLDAHMRELAATGFQSNRGRQNAASWLINDAGLDWRVGAAYFESALLDHDPASNYGNWCALTGQAAPGARLNVFNLAKQAKDYDPDGSYTRSWVPELAGLAGGSVHDPAGCEKDALSAAGVVLGETYPTRLPSVVKRGPRVEGTAGRFGGGGGGRRGGGGGGRGGGRGGGGRGRGGGR
jgi:deoxyribodipyrimidine photo-lyase